MKLPDYYQILQVDPWATVEEIKQAYRRLALENHPDRGGSHERMLAINEAFFVLSNPSTRATHDQSRSAQVSVEIRQRAEQDSARAASAAGDYPKNFGEFDKWVDSLERDADSSTSGFLFILAGGIAGCVVSGIIYSSLGHRGGAGRYIYGAPIVAGLWLGQMLHRGVRSTAMDGQHNSKPVKAGSTAVERQIVDCPKCGQKLRADLSSAGRQLRCPKCSKEFHATTQPTGAACVALTQDENKGIGFAFVAAIVGLIFFSRSCTTQTLPGLFTNGYEETNWVPALFGTAIVTAIAYAVGKGWK